METNLNQAKFRISTTELEISGPADFVKDQVQFNKNIIDFFAETIKQGILGKELPKTLEFEGAERLNLPKANGEYADFEEVKEADGILEKYRNVVAVNGDKIQILGKIQGSSMGARMLKLILVYLYIKTKAFATEKVQTGDIRNFCELHGDLDAGHFSQYLRNNKKLFLVDGSGKNITAMITVPGMKEAEQILDNMNN